MTSRFLLRFETGERRGEEVPIEGPRVTIGRRSANQVRVVDPSVSGEHAELLLQGDEVELTDCGSTNGVRVAGRRVSRCELRVGDVFALGSVKLRLLSAANGDPSGGEPAGAGLLGDADERSADEAPLLEEFGADAVGAPGPQRATDGRVRGGGASDEIAHTAVFGAEEVGEGVGTVSAASVQRAGKRSAVVIALAALLVVGGGLLAWRQFGPGDGPAGGAFEPPPRVEGNLLAGGTFEDEDGAPGWVALGESPVHLAPDRVWRHTGRFGLGADLRGGDWAAAASPEVRVRPRRALVASAWLQVEDDAGARLGLRLTSGAGRARALSLWSAPVGPTAGFERRELAVDVPATYDRAEVLIDAGVPAEGEASERSGLVSVDDVALVQEDGERGAGLAFEEFRLWPVGDPPARALLVQIDRVLLDARLETPDGGRPALFGGGARGAFAVRGADGGAVLVWSGAPAGTELRVRVDAELAGGGLATTGPAGYRAHTLDFEEPRAASVLFGSGLDLVRLTFPEPTPVRGRPDEGGFELRVGAGSAGELALQLSFARDRGRAQQLAAGAREQEAQGRLGDAMNTWSELLNTYPFEEALVRAAEETRARLLERGLDEVQALRREMERARFFGLSELTRRYGERADELARRYADTEVGFAALALFEEIRHELAALERGEVARRRERLAAIADLLSEGGAEDLAEHVRDQLDGPLGGGGDG